MPNTNAESGKNYERRVIAYLNEFDPDFRAFKNPQPTWADVGDIRFSTVVLQAKTSPTGLKTMTKYLDDAAEQAARNETDVPLLPVVIIRDGTDVGDDVVVLRARDLLDIVSERDRLETLVNNSPDL